MAGHGTLLAFPKVETATGLAHLQGAELSRDRGWVLWEWRWRAELRREELASKCALFCLKKINFVRCGNVQESWSSASGHETRDAVSPVNHVGESGFYSLRQPRQAGARGAAVVWGATSPAPTTTCSHHSPASSPAVLLPFTSRREADACLPPG